MDIRASEEIAQLFAIPASGMTLALGASWSLYALRRKWRKGAALYSLAAHAAGEFYRLADEVMSDPATPDTLHDAVYDMTSSLTNDDLGAILYPRVIENLDAVQGKSHRNSELGEQIRDLAKSRVDLYEKVNEAFGAWLFALVATHGHSDVKLSMTMAKSTDRSALIETIDRLMTFLDGNGNDGIGGTRKTVEGGAI